MSIYVILLFSMLSKYYDENSWESWISFIFIGKDYLIRTMSSEAQTNCFEIFYKRFICINNRFSFRKKRTLYLISFKKIFFKKSVHRNQMGSSTSTNGSSTSDGSTSKSDIQGHVHIDTEGLGQNTHSDTKGNQKPVPLASKPQTTNNKKWYTYYSRFSLSSSLWKLHLFLVYHLLCLFFSCLRFTLFALDMVLLFCYFICVIFLLYSLEENGAKALPNENSSHLRILFFSFAFLFVTILKL